MRFHTKLSTDAIADALERVKDRGQITEDVRFAVFMLQASQTHEHSYEIQLGTDDQDSLPAGYADQNGRRLRVRRARNTRDGGPRWAATWHEWGWLIAELFEADPGSRWGTDPARSRHPERAWGYFSPEDFHAKTGNQFKPAELIPEVVTMPATQTLRAFREDGTEIQPGDTISMGAGDTTFRSADRASNAERAGGAITVTQGTQEYTDMFPRPFGLTVRRDDPGLPAPVLRAFREDGTEVRPGDAVTQYGIDYTFRSADLPAADSIGDGKITVETSHGIVVPDLYARPFGLIVRTGNEPGPAWFSVGNDISEGITRAIRGSGGFRAVIGRGASGRLAWSVIDSSDGVTIDHGNVSNQAEGKQAVLDWEQANIPAAPGSQPGSSGRPEPALPDLTDALAACDRGEDGALTALYHAVKAQLAPAPDAWQMAGEATRDAQRMAPPVPGITVNRYTGHAVYAVIRTNHVPGEPADDEWVVAAEKSGEHATWTARASADGTLYYHNGHYHTTGSDGSARKDALVDLANRAGIFAMLDELSSGPAARGCFQDSHAKVLEELADYGVGRARVRAGLLEAAALGYARISWHSDRTRNDYGIRYDRVSCTFTWQRKN